MKYLKEFDITNNQNIISDILDDADLDFKFNKSISFDYEILFTNTCEENKKFMNFFYESEVEFRKSLTNPDYLDNIRPYGFGGPIGRIPGSDRIHTVVVGGSRHERVQKNPIIIRICQLANVTFQGHYISRPSEFNRNPYLKLYFSISKL